MVQLHLDVGQKDALMAVCKVCDMHYSRGVASDESAHRKFHDTFVHGVDWAIAPDVSGSGALSEYDQHRRCFLQLFDALVFA